MMKRREFCKGIARGAAWTLAGGIWVRARGAVSPAGPAGGFRQVGQAAAAGGGGGSCPADGSPSQQSDQVNESHRVGSTTDNRRGGMAGWDDGGTPRTICKLAFEISAIEGDVSGKTFNAWIYTMTGGNLNALQATSDNLTGVAVTGWLVFPFSTPFLTSASVPYALIFGQPAADAVNYVWVVSNDTNAITGYRELFNDAGAGQFGGAMGLDQSIRIYWQ